MIPNLMIGFGIDQIQAEYVAEIKLRNINKEYILKRVQETEHPAEGDRRPGGHVGQARARIRKIIIDGAGARPEEVRRAPRAPRSSTATRSRSIAEEERGPRTTP